MFEKDAEINRKGNRLLVQRSYQAAREAFEQLISHSPDNPDGYIGLAKVLSRQDNYHEIVSRLEGKVDRLDSNQLLRLFADALRILANRGEVQYRKRAIEYYRQYHKKRLDQVTLFYQGELMIQEGDFSEAADVLRASWEQDRRSREVFACLLDCLKSLDRNDDIKEIQQLFDQASS